MFDHLDATIATALANDPSLPSPRDLERRRRRRAVLTAIGLTVTAALTTAAATVLSEESEPVVAVSGAGTATTVTAAAETTAPVVTAAPAPVETAPPTPAPTAAPAPPPTAPPPAPVTVTAPPPASLEWSVSAPPEAESVEASYPVTLSVRNPTAVRLQFTYVRCDRIRRVTIEADNVLEADLGASSCETLLDFVEAGDAVTWVQPVRLRTGAGRVPPGDYTLSMFGLRLPVRIVPPTPQQHRDSVPRHEPEQPAAP